RVFSTSIESPQINFDNLLQDTAELSPNSTDTPTDTTFPLNESSESNDTTDTNYTHIDTDLPTDLSVDNDLKSEFNLDQYLSTIESQKLV
ncbi:hypothetical protein BB560_004951, partial [Smittium megazygosporum]